MNAEAGVGMMCGDSLGVFSSTVSHTHKAWSPSHFLPFQLDDSTRLLEYEEILSPLQLYTFISSDINAALAIAEVSYCIRQSP